MVKKPWQYDERPATTPQPLTQYPRVRTRRPPYSHNYCPTIKALFAKQFYFQMQSISIETTE